MNDNGRQGPGPVPMPGNWRGNRLPIVGQVPAGQVLNEIPIDQATPEVLFDAARQLLPEGHGATSFLGLSLVQLEAAAHNIRRILHAQGLDVLKRVPHAKPKIVDEGKGSGEG